MNSDELSDYLGQYIGRKVRIWSRVTGNNMVWQPGHYPRLVSVTLAPDEGATHTRVWCEFDNGVAIQVDDDALTVELEPANGTYDFAEGRDQMEAIGTAIRRYGPTEKTLRDRCSCLTCQIQHQAEDDAVQETFKDAYNHGPTNPELDLKGW